MNVFGIGFLIGISLVGGIIALLADNLGRTIGKKRISFRKLRPRRTAQVFTFSAGAAIPLLTVAVVAFASEGVRKWFVEGPALVDERDRLSQDVGRLKSDQERLGIEIKTRTIALEETNKKLATAAEQEKRARAQLAKAAADVARLDASVKAKTARVASLERQFRVTADDLQKARRDLAAETRRLESAKVEYRELGKDYQELDRQKTETERHAIELQNQIVSLERDRGQLDRQLATLQTDIATATARMEADRVAFGKETERYSLERERLNLEIDGLKGERRTFQEQIEMMRKIGGNSRTLPLTYTMGEELARVPVAANLKRGDAQNALNRLLRESRANAEDRGAKASGPNAAAGIVERIVDDRPVSVETQVQRIVDRLTGLSEEFLLVATSSLNAFKGEPVSVDVQIFRNPVVFPQGELVAETRIDGERTENVLVEQIQDFVRTQVREKAKTRGMIPLFGQDAGYGVLDQNVLIDLMRSARANNRRVRLQAWAPKDIRAGDILELEYRIR